MAKVLYTAVVGDVRNKLGGVVFSTGPGGAIARIFHAPTQPRAPRQLEIRATTKALSVRWGWILTQDQRDDWMQFAQDHPITDVFGQTVYLSGLAFYVWVNQNLRSISQAVRDDVPAVWTAGDPDSCTVDVSGPPYVLTINPTTGPGANDHALITAAPPSSPGRIFVGKRWRISKAFGAGVGGPYDVTTQYETKFGSLRAGEKVQLQMCYIDDRCGKKGPLVQNYDIVP